MVADVHDLDDGGGAGHGHLPAAAGDGYPWSPTNIGKLGLTIFGLSPYSSVGKYCCSL